MDRLAGVLMRRLRVVVPETLLDGAVPPARGRRGRRAEVANGLMALEADLVELGFVVAADLRAALGALTGDQLAVAGRRLVDLAQREVGADVLHVPLFRHFPESVPEDTLELYVRRMFTRLVQEREQPCALCGDRRSVHPVRPCAHLVCRNCWDGGEYTACPLCHRRVDPKDAFLRPTRERAGRAPSGTARRTILLAHGSDAAGLSRDLLRSLLTRQTPLSERDRADVAVLLGENLPASAGWLPPRVPVRASRAAALAVLLPAVDDPAPLLEAHVDTATDVLRLLFALSGGDPALDALPPRRVSPPRWLRRALLDRMERLPLPLLAEDLRRHGEKWKHAAEVLHPFASHRRHPGVATAFAALRRTRLDPATAFGGTVLERAAEHPATFVFDGERLRVTTFAGHTERAMRHGGAAAGLLAQRPGELVRRLGRLARLETPALEAAVAEAVPRVAPGVLVAALGQIRTPEGGRRVFFPRGGTTWIAPDRRPPIGEERRAALTGLLAGELRARARELPGVGSALLDAGLADLVAPTSDRTASAALVRMPRGSVQPIPRGPLRLFLHWMEQDGARIDLDLSVAVFDESWAFVGVCDYTGLRLGDGAAVHSGDLTSAPAPLGATEYVDLDLRALRMLGGRYAVPVVLSYNTVPFDRLRRGFAGLMSSPGRQFDPVAVEQRFDLAGPAKVLVPFVADLWSRRMRWVDLDLSGVGHGLNVHGYSLRLGRLAQAVEQVYGEGGRVTLWELACWHAGARASNVTVRSGNGSLVRYVRGAGEDADAFTGRLLAGGEPDDVRPPPPDPGFAALVKADLDLPGGTEVYALYPWRLDASKVRLLDAADLLSPLVPARVPARIEA
ncbi:MXAN_6230/SCO0854 family RING domain-containing protein [Actinocorallia longicatena]|uniref:RING-type domain-containing protein n=1 Tax=Actinocorallia longicatena TaxID=111803 RepID=A0ABP6Q546_9ACTN